MPAKPFPAWVLTAAKLVVAPWLFVLGPVRVTGSRKVPKKGGVLILANHLADIDPIVLQYGAPRHLYFMAKSELFEMKGVGWMLRRWRAFPVRRGEADRGALKHAIDLLREGHAVCVFPEGQLSETGELQPIKPGVALIARQAKVPVMCARLDNTNKMLPYGKLIPRPAWSTVWCRWGELAEITKESDPDATIAWVRAQLSGGREPMPDQPSEGLTPHPA